MALAGRQIGFRDETPLIRLLFPLLCFSLLVPGAPAHAAVLIVHVQVEEQALPRNLARLLFTMRVVRWRNGKKVHVFVLPDRHPVHQEFAKQSLDLYPRQLRRVWDRHLFSGAGTIPAEVDSVEAMLRRVAETPGAIGYLPDDVVSDEVRVIHVID
jgi:hypothetical protein